MIQKKKFLIHWTAQFLLARRYIVPVVNFFNLENSKHDVFKLY